MLWLRIPHAWAGDLRTHDPGGDGSVHHRYGLVVTASDHSRHRLLLADGRAAADRFLAGWAFARRLREYRRR
ncbi:MAG: hypothetical protein ACTHOK_19885 [Nocardioidaceae bacterium]